MTAAQITEAVATIRRVEAAMISEMTSAEYCAYKKIPAEDRKHMLYIAYKLAA
jgi:hypothetical protein